MRRVSSWFIVGVVMVCGWSMAWGQNIEDIVFYDAFESGETSGWWAPARVGETGQKTCYDVAGTVIACDGTGQDGDIQAGVEWPVPRFVDNADGTVTDMLTGLVWLRDASCSDLAGTNEDGEADWATALAAAQALAHGTCGLTDNSVAGEWRLPNRREMENILDLEYSHPVLSNAEGTAQWTEGDVFVGVPSNAYWTSSTYAFITSLGWRVYINSGDVSTFAKTSTGYVWPVRGGR